MNAAQVYDTSADAAEKSIASELVVVSMLVKPDSTDNLIDNKSEDVIPVAILTTSTLSGDAADFDATQVDTLSVLFGPNGSTAVLTSGQIVDVDMDGDFDLMLNFPSMNAGFSCGDSRAVITGKTFTNQFFTAIAPIVVPSCTSVTTVGDAGGDSSGGSVSLLGLCIIGLIGVARRKKA